MTNNIESITAVYNDVELIQASLESIKDHVDKNHIVEGSWFPNQSKRSTDGTIEVIQAFKDRNPDKVEIYFHDYAPNAMHNQPGLSNANAIANAMLARQRALSCVKSDWVFMVDSDEVYKSDDLDNLIMNMEEPCEKSRRLLEFCHQMEKEQDDEDTEMLIRLIKIRHHLWT